MRCGSSQNKQICVSFLPGFSNGFTLERSHRREDGSASRGLTPCTQEWLQSCTQGSGAAPPLFPHRMCSAVSVCLHVALQEICFHAQGEERLARFLHISVFSGEACLRRSEEDSTAVSSLLGDNQSPSRSTLRAQLHNSLCSLEGTAPYVQFPSYI